MVKRIAALAGVLMIVAAIPATAKPVSTYRADFMFEGTTDVLSVEFTELQVTSVKLSMSCGGGEFISYDSTSIDASMVAAGPKAGSFDVSAQFTASFVDCDASETIATRHVHLSNFTVTGATERERDRSAGTRTIAVPVEADVSFSTLPNQPLQGVFTKVISKG